ncbi:hypothetical protein R5R35_002996 [Gryllus longicercus]|uniref:Uncharacterized protein n=1 Tax=Gryllus longicercus TaxID=2509291 RepID=A0AAN9ZAN6_9ORTH
MKFAAVNTSHSVIHPTHSPPLHQTQPANCSSGERTCENERGAAAGGSAPPAAPCGGLPRASCLHLHSSSAVRRRRRRGAGKAKGTGLLTPRARISASPPNAERNNTQSGPEKA